MPALQSFEPRRISLNGKRYNSVNALHARMNPKHDLTGQRIGRLVVLEQGQSLKGASTWWCQCDCGSYKQIRGSYLRNGDAVSCGCYHREKHRIHGRRGKDGDPRDPTYLSFVAMKGRIMNCNNPAYHNYGGRGIQICSEWIEGGFTEFLKDMGNRPSGTSLDRIDTNGDYSPDNCRWATLLEQSQNRRGVQLLTCNEKTQSFAAWAKELGFSRYMLRQKLKMGMTINDILKEINASREVAE